MSLTSGCRRGQKEKEVTFDKETHGSYRAGVNRMHSPMSEETDFCMPGVRAFFKGSLSF